MLEYMIWANEQIFKILLELPESKIEKDLGENLGSIGNRILHLAEENMWWLYYPQEMEWKPALESISKMSTIELITYLSENAESWKEFINDNPDRIFRIDEDDGVIVDLSTSEIVFNLVNHNTYHRGQIMTLLRKQDVDPVTTDFYWYKRKKSPIKSP